MFVLTNGIYKNPVYEKNNMRVREQNVSHVMEAVLP